MLAANEAVAVAAYSDGLVACADVGSALGH